MPCFNNLVRFDPLKKTESVGTIFGELAERLVFLLRKG
jgi:hypothetical protein